MIFLICIIFHLLITAIAYDFQPQSLVYSGSIYHVLERRGVSPNFPTSRSSDNEEGGWIELPDWSRSSPSQDHRGTRRGSTNHGERQRLIEPSRWSQPSSISGYVGRRRTTPSRNWRLGTPAKVDPQPRRASTPKPQKPESVSHSFQQLQRSQSLNVDPKARQSKVRLWHSDGVYPLGRRLQTPQRVRNERILKSDGPARLGAWSPRSEGLIAGKCKGDIVSCVMELGPGGIGTVTYENGQKTGGFQKIGYQREEYKAKVTTTMTGKPVSLQASIIGKGIMSLEAKPKSTEMDRERMRRHVLGG